MNYRVIPGIQWGQRPGFQDPQLLLTLDEGFTLSLHHFKTSIQGVTHIKALNSHNQMSILHFTDKETEAT